MSMNRHQAVGAYQRWDPPSFDAPAPAAAPPEIEDEALANTLTEVADTAEPEPPAPVITADPELADVKVLVLTTFEADDHVLAALRAGIQDDDAQELLDQLGQDDLAGDGLGEAQHHRRIQEPAAEQRRRRRDHTATTS